jgi:hypothetical protein
MEPLSSISLAADVSDVVTYCCCLLKPRVDNRLGSLPPNVQGGRVGLLKDLSRHIEQFWTSNDLTQRSFAFKESIALCTSSTSAWGWHSIRAPIGNGNHSESKSVRSVPPLEAWNGVHTQVWIVQS